MPTWAISSLVETFFERLLDVLDDGLDREVDAALQVHRVHAGGDRLGALADDRLGQHGRGGGAVAGQVAGLRGDLAHHLRAHVLELVGELDLLGDGDAVLGDARRAERLVEHDVAALRAQRHLDRIGENVDAAQHPVARVGVKSDFLGSHFSYSLMRLCGQRLLDDAHDVAFLHDDQLLAVDLDLGAGPLAEQHAVAGLDVERLKLAVLAAGAGADGDDLALHRLFLGGVGDDDAARGLLLRLDAPDQHAVVQRTESHVNLLERI